MYVLVQYKKEAALVPEGSLLVKFFPASSRFDARRYADGVRCVPSVARVELCEDQDLGRKLANHFSFETYGSAILTTVESAEKHHTSSERGCSFMDRCEFSAEDCPFLEEDDVVDAIWLDDEDDSQPKGSTLIQIISEVVDMEALRAYLKAEPGTIFRVISQNGKHSWVLGKCDAAVLAKIACNGVDLEDLLLSLGEAPEEDRGALLTKEGTPDLHALIDYVLDHGDPEVYLHYLRQNLLADAPCWKNSLV